MGCGSCSAGGCAGGGCRSGCGSQSGRAGTSGCPSMHVFDWLNDFGIARPATGYDFIEVVFKGGRKGFFRLPEHLDVVTGDAVIVEADRGVDYGAVNMMGELVRIRLRQRAAADRDSFPEVVRAASPEDVERRRANQEYEAETFLIGRRTIDRMNLPMKLVDVEWQFDRSKVTFYFTAEHRVDFRQLVRDLAGRFRTRVELRQIGARDEAARLGGIGSCGRELCCSTWLEEFKPVSTQAAKIQNLPLNPVRLSGQCGRLKCCLNYELEQYMDALEEFPRVDTRITTPYGAGVIHKLDIFQRIVWIEYPDGTWEDKPLDAVLELMRAGGKTPPAEPAERRRGRGKGSGRRDEPGEGSTASLPD